MYIDVVSALVIEDYLKIVSDEAAVGVKNDQEIAGFRVCLQIVRKYLGINRY